MYTKIFDLDMEIIMKVNYSGSRVSGIVLECGAFWSPNSFIMLYFNIIKLTRGYGGIGKEESKKEAS